MFGQLSLEADVVAHELTHGITEKESGLIYYGESGAVNEAISDIFGAVVDRKEGASEEDTFKIGEGIYTPSIPGDALRYMADPELDGISYDYYPDRYMGDEDYGGVHLNSGIANLAFALLVKGGQHPRGKTSVQVPAIDEDFDTSLLEAARIFYYANTACLTPLSGFAAARYCTSMHSVSNETNVSYETNVKAAWDAVGVPEHEIKEPIPIFNAEPLSGQSAEEQELQQYVLKGVPAGMEVTCKTEADTGDADLYVRFGAEAVGDPSSSLNRNNCTSATWLSSETCTTPATVSETDVYAGVHAWEAYTDLTIVCSYEDIQPPIVLTNGQPTSGQSGVTGGVQHYVLRNVAADAYVTCETSSTNADGDADLYVRFGAEAVADSSSTLNHCSSAGAFSNEECRTPVAGSLKDAYAAVYGYSSYSNLSIKCTKKKEQPPCSPIGTRCTNHMDCGSCKRLTCDGKRPGNKKCKKCRRRNKRCKRTTQCCQGHKCKNKRCKRV